MELYAVKAAHLVADCHVGTAVAVRGEREVIRDSRHVIAMAHPGNALFGQRPEKPAVRIEEGECPSVLPCGIILGSDDFAAQSLRHQLAAVAYAENWDAERKHLRVDMGRVRVVYTARTSGKDDADGIECTDLLYGDRAGTQLTVYSVFPDAPCDELVVLASEVDDENRLMFHGSPQF